MNPPLSENTGLVHLTPIHFELRNSSASSVCVAGTFNNWNPRRGRMTRESRDHWVRTISLPAGAYEYCLVVDREWMLDPLNQLSVANSFGRRNSVLVVDPFDQAGHLREAESEIMSGAAKAEQNQVRNFAAQKCREFAASVGSNSTVGRTCLGPRPQ
jgi:hypothetical protein